MSATAEILQRTFLHAPGIGSKTERSLWNEGITTWSKFLDSLSVAFKTLRSRPQVLKIIDGQQMETLIAGHNLKKLPDLLARYDIVVTFNGTLFDLPFLKTKLPSLRLPPIHLDLRYLLKRLGYSGGLKEIERTLGIRRGKGAQAVDGYLATVLWSRYKRGDLSALEQLVQYNVADVTNLRSLLQFTSRQLTARLVNGAKTRKLLGERKYKTFPVQVTRTSGIGVQLRVGENRVLLRNRTVERPPIALQDLLGCRIILLFDLISRLNTSTGAFSWAQDRSWIRALKAN